jgi:hypothetical protein
MLFTFDPKFDTTAQKERKHRHRLEGKGESRNVPPNWNLEKKNRNFKKKEIYLILINIYTV